MPKGQVGGGKRRSTKGLPTVPRSYIEGLIEKVEQFYSQRDKGTEWYNYMAKLRLKSIIALLYLSGRRISELTGRVYHYGDGRRDDVYEGVKLKDFLEATIFISGETSHMTMHIKSFGSEILKMTSDMPFRIGCSSVMVMLVPIG